MSSITRVLASFMALLAALFSLLMPAEPEEPRFPETKVREKIAFDEGEFVLKSCDIMVSPQGDDKNHGTSDAPLKTPEAAKERAKLLKDADCGHVTVWFREGVYTLSDTLEFTADDLTDVTYRSYPNERVVFSAAMEITGWTRTTVNGVNAFVTDCAINSEGDFFNAVYNGETRLKRPVYPKVGEFSVSKALDDDAFRPDIELFKLHAAFYANTSDVMSFKNLNDVDVRILHYWNDELLPILSLDPATGRIETQKPASMTIFENDRFFFENVFEALSDPGEWYLDRTSEKLYYIPFAGETPEDTVLNASLVEQLVTLNGCKNISFQGIEFRDSAWDIHSGEHWSTINDKSHPLFPNLKYQPNFPQACFDSPCAVTLKGCETVTFADCGFKNIGSSALMFGEGSRNCRAEAFKFDNIGGNAVYIKGVNEKGSASVTNGITVTDCHIKTYGRVFNNAIGVLLVHAYDCEISQNEIHDGFYTAISSGWMWGYAENITNNIKIKNNLIYDIGQGWLSDMGGIYTLGIQPNSVISGNVIHDVGCYAGGSGYGGWGVYLDEGTSGMLVENNLAYNCSSQGFHQHYGKDNMIRNNIFALNGDAQMRVSKHEEHNSLFFYNNILLGDDSPMYFSAEKGQFTDNGNVYWDYTYEGKVLSGTDTSRKKRKTISDMERLGYYNNATFADPMFKDAKGGDFTLASNSPVFAAGFKAWNYSAAGTPTQF